jgi:flagellin
MAISIISNVSSLNSQRNLTKTTNSLSSNFAKLSSGMRINTAGDDAAGLAISERMKSQIRSLGQAERNANDGSSLLQTAEGALNENSGILIRMRELAMQSSNGTLGASETDALQTEFKQLTDEIDRIANVTEFNGKKLLDGSAAGGITFQVGIGTGENDKITATIETMTAASYGKDSEGEAINLAELKIGGEDSDPAAALDAIDKAIAANSAQRAQIGATQNRLAVTVSNLQSASTNLSAANSRIRDVDVAEESASMTKNNILSQAGISVLAQANQLPQMALKLLG